MKTHKIFLENAEDCVGKIVCSTRSYGGIGSGPMRVLCLRKDLSYQGSYILEIHTLACPSAKHFILFYPGRLWTETPEYVARWKDRINS